MGIMSRFHRDMGTVTAAQTATELELARTGPKQWTPELIMDDDGKMFIRLTKRKVWTQAPVLSIDPPSWGEFAPLPLPKYYRQPPEKWTPVLTKLIRKGTR